MWKLYTIIKTLSTIKQIKLINKKNFIKIALDENIKAFVIFVTFLNLSLMSIYSVKKV